MLRWNGVSEIELRIGQHDHAQGSAPTPTLQDHTDLAARLESVWNHPDTDA